MADITRQSSNLKDEIATSIPNVEWPTLFVSTLIYTGWFSLIWWHEALPLWFLIPAGAWLVAWHGSLQHECIHGHPTRHQWLNDMIAVPSLSLWLPYFAYKSSHLAHHRDEDLTIAGTDPESYFVTSEVWHALPRPVRAIVSFRNTLVGRFLVGPLEAAIRFWSGTIVKLLNGDFSEAPGLLIHIAMLTGIWFLVTVVCGMHFGFYMLAIAWPGISLSLLRSFAEHREAETFEHRTAIVETCWVWRLLFLNNSYHVVHHMYPQLPWYRVARTYHAHKRFFADYNGGYIFDGYRTILRRYAFSPVIEPIFRKI